MNNILKFFATGAFISYIPTAILKNKKNTGAGLLGTFEGLLLFLFFMPQNYFAYALVLAVFIVFSAYVSEKADFGDGKKDNPKIVIDEIAGYFVAAAFLPRTGIVIIGAFILFRIFDTTKLAFISKAENFGYKLPEVTQRKYWTSGFAVVLDDVAAGICANIILQILLLAKII